MKYFTKIILSTWKFAVLADSRLAPKFFKPKISKC